MNPRNRPRIINANCWDKEMADAFSLTEPMRKSNEFDLMHSRLNPESISMVFASNGYSNACGTGQRNLCLNKCDVLHGDIQYNACVLSHLGRSDNKAKCRNEVAAKRNACKNGCPKSDAECIESKPSGTFGIGTGTRKACKDMGLTGAEKRECARQLKVRGWKKGQPIPPDMAGITQDDVEAVISEPKDTPIDAPMPSDSGAGACEKFL